MANKKTTISCQCPIDIRNKFQRLYPYTLSRFLLQCIKFAISDKNFFDKVYFENFVSNDDYKDKVLSIHLSNKSEVQ